MIGSTGESPPAALERVASRLVPRPPVSQPLGEGVRGYLAEAVEIEISPGFAAGGTARPRIALRNGFAVPGGLGEGAECRVLGALHPGGALDEYGTLVRSGSFRALTPPEPPEGVPGIWRVETGAALPTEAAAVVPPEDAVLVGSRRVRILRRPEPGSGVWPDSVRGRGARLRFPPGTYVGARVCSVLLAAGAVSLPLVPKPAVAFATIGDELTDTGAPLEPGRVPDLVGLALEGCLRELGFEPLAFGILGDAPADFERAAVRARERGADVFVVSGGLGPGFGDRTRESLEKLEAEIAFAGSIAGEGFEVLLARIEGCHFLALSGRPLAASAEIDLLVRPGLLRMLGAPAASWNWASGPEVPLLEPADAQPRRGSWAVLPARRARAAGGAPACAAWEAPHPWMPWTPGQEGWAVVPPRPPEAPGAPAPALARFVAAEEL
ncbi:MAG: molybdopterin-binding protein [Planctomycetota bacterium]